MSEIRPAATVILLRDSKDGLQALLLRRNSRLGFAGGMWVFPGGRIDEVEIEQCGGDLDAAAQLAAVRETAEEAQLEISAGQLVYYSHWTTPPHHPKRFSTWFFAAHAPDSSDVVVDGGEIHEHLWTTAADALAAHAAGDIEMMPPTFVALTEMQSCASADEFMARTLARSSAGKACRFEPHFDFGDKEAGDAPVALYDGDAGYEAVDRNMPGPRHRCICKPGAWVYENTVYPW